LCFALDYLHETKQIDLYQSKITHCVIYTKPNKKKGN